MQALSAATLTSPGVLRGPSSTARAAERASQCGRVRCAASSADEQAVEFPRRAALASLLAAGAAAAAPDRALASATLQFTEPEDLTSNPQLQRGLSKYIKRKQLEPIEYYVPPLLLAREQLALVPEAAKAAQDDAMYKGVRQYLRLGPFASFRDNCRRVGEYVYLQDKGRKDEMEAAVANAIDRVDAADAILFKASRPGAKTVSDDDIAAAVAKADAGIAALLATLPADVIAAGQKVADASVGATQESLEAGAEEGSAEGAAASSGPAPAGAKESSLKALEGLL